MPESKGKLHALHTIRKFCKTAMEIKRAQSNEEFESLCIMLARRWYNQCSDQEKKDLEEKA